MSHCTGGALKLQLARLTGRKQALRVATCNSPSFSLAVFFLLESAFHRAKEESRSLCPSSSSRPPSSFFDLLPFRSWFVPGSLCFASSRDPTLLQASTRLLLTPVLLRFLAEAVACASLVAATSFSQHLRFARRVTTRRSHCGHLFANCRIAGRRARAKRRASPRTTTRDSEVIGSVPSHPSFAIVLPRRKQ